jgi:radical SAM protein with 4Fe4S-binding SPASM domain
MISGTSYPVSGTKISHTARSAEYFLAIILLPSDCTLLPLTSGMLLVSPSHAVFCRVPPAKVGAMRAVLAGQAPLNALGRLLLGDLEKHGFFASPRSPKADPPSVQIQLTNACNLACAYCCTNSGRARRQEVTYEQMLQVVRQIPEAFGPGTSVALLGGEPLFVPWALDLAAEIIRLGLPLTIFTNGVPLAKDGLAQDLARLMRQGAQVRVSLSGPTPETCDTLAGARRFEAALAGVRRLVTQGGMPAVDLMFTPQGVDSIARHLPALRKRLPPKTPITFGILYLSGRERGEHLFGSRTDLEAALDRVALETGEAIPAAQASTLTYRRDGCGCALGNHIHVRSDGALFNCFKMEEQVGHLDTDGFINAAMRIRERPHLARDLPACAACPLATLCGGGCRSENLLYNGDADAPPCGPWRVRTLSELLAEGRVTAVEWPVAFLLQEAQRRGIEAPDHLTPRTPSRHLVDVY